MKLIIVLFYGNYMYQRRPLLLHRRGIRKSQKVGNIYPYPVQERPSSVAVILIIISIIWFKLRQWLKMQGGHVEGEYKENDEEVVAVTPYWGSVMRGASMGAQIRCFSSSFYFCHFWGWIMEQIWTQNRGGWVEGCDEELSKAALISFYLVRVPIDVLLGSGLKVRRSHNSEFYYLYI